MLESTATKREAKAYLSRFGSQRTGLPFFKSPRVKVKDAGVNLGNLFLPVRAVDENPVFSTTPVQSPLVSGALKLLHVALIKIRAPQSVDEATLHGVGHTLSQLSRLELSCMVVVDPANGLENESPGQARMAFEQADRIVETIEAYGGQGARLIDNVLGVAPANKQILPSVKLHSGVQIADRELLLAPLRRGLIPVIAPIGFTFDTQRRVVVDADEVVLAVTRDFAGLQTNALVDDDPEEVAERIRLLQKQISLDRIIILDPLGGIPSTDKMHGSHVFINLEQEFDTIRRNLLRAGNKRLEDKNLSTLTTSSSDASRAMTLSVTSETSLASELATTERTGRQNQNTNESGCCQLDTKIHIRNLDLLETALALLPPSSSAFLTTAEAVANSQSRPPLASQGPRVRIRRQRNPLIYNLLTDKPLFSSSLPSSRAPNPSMPDSLASVTSSPATFFKRGMSVGLIPDPSAKPWIAPSPAHPSISMSDPRIDFPRLVHLIEDSFSRKLDVRHYLNRIKDRIAGIIIAGEYEGGAILTWETPPGYPADNPNHMVPYLDKFAVLKRSQGSGGVADIVFNAMVRDCFPQGVCWRSRKDNPVNKWYFERAKGTWKLPNNNWTMFWTTAGVGPGDGLFSKYKGVCKAVEPSWAEKKQVVD